MVKLNALFKYIFVSSVAVVILITTAIPSLAYRIPSSSIYPDRVIDGKLFSAIILEPSDFQAMFYSEGIDISCTILSSDFFVGYTDLESNTYMTKPSPFSVPYDFVTHLLSATTRNTPELIIEYPIIISGPSGNISSTYVIDLPFSFMFLGGSLDVSFFDFNSIVTESSLSFNINTPYNTTYQAIFNNGSLSTGTWSDENIYVENIVLGYGYTNNRNFSYLKYEIEPNILHEVNSISISSSSFGSRDNIASPVGIILGEWVVYVNNDGWEDPDKPTYSELVQDYLDEIVNISPENQERVDELRNQLEEVDSVFNNIQSGLEIEIPDVNDLQDTIDADVLNGSSQFSQNILSPILNTNILIALFGGLFAVVTMKLVLFGSGKS